MSNSAGDTNFGLPQPAPKKPTGSGPGTQWALAAILTVIVVVVIGALTMCQRQPSNPAKPKIQAAAEACGLAGRAGDTGHTLTLNTKGKQDASGDAMPTVGCVLSALSTPESVTAHMDQTRALDGIQTETWSDVTARWSFHPDSGMTLILTSPR